MPSLIFRDEDLGEVDPFTESGNRCAFSVSDQVVIGKLFAAIEEAVEMEIVLDDPSHLQHGARIR